MNDAAAMPLIVKGAFILFALAAIGGAVFLFFTKNILYGAYGLLCTMLAVSGIYVLAGAEFIAISQIMIYVGGILVLLLFGIMLSAKKGKRYESLLVENINTYPALFLIGLVAAGLWYVAQKMQLAGVNMLEYKDSIKPIGISLMTYFVLILEIIGIFLLLALIGATYIAKKD